jgi:nitroreductase
MLMTQEPARTSVEQTYRPRPFQLSQASEREAMRELLKHDDGIQVCDTIRCQLQDLIRTRHADRKFTPDEVDRLASRHLETLPGDDYGVWFYYPWSKRLVHLLDEGEFVELRTNRNLYKITHRERSALAGKRVGIVGLSVGQSAALTIAMERSCRELRLADFDLYDLSNLNRVRTGVHNIGVPKVVVTAREIAEIDPYLLVTCFPAGITEENCDKFLLQDGPLDVVIEECDSIDIKVLVRDRAKSHRIPVVMDTCDRGMIDVERFDLEPERPIFHGLAQGLAAGKMRGLTTEEKIPYVLAILGIEHLSTRLRASLIEVEQTISTWPQLASSVAMGGGAAADVVRRICLGEAVLSGRYYVDVDQLVPSAKNTRDAGGAICARSCELTERAIIEAVRDLPARAATTYCPSHNLIRRLVKDAVLAPSGGNCQPWKWLYDGKQLHVFHDRSRSRAPYDPQGLGSVLAIGCAAENLMLSATSAGLRVACDLLPQPATPELIASFRFSQDDDDTAEVIWRPELYEYVGTRRTNRALQARRPLQTADKEALTAAVHSISGAEIYWLEDEGALLECADLLGRTDVLQLTSKPLHEFLVSEIRWTPQEAQTTRDGISLESLELSPSDRAGFELCRDWSTLHAVRQVGSGRNLEKSGRKAIASASAVGLVTAPAKTAAEYFRAGRAVERMWLSSTERRLALHPMTSLPYLLAEVEGGGGLGYDEWTKHFCEQLVPRYHQLFPVREDCAHVFLFRVSYAQSTAWSSLRRGLDEVLAITN